MADAAIANGDGEVAEAAIAPMPGTLLVDTLVRLIAACCTHAKGGCERTIVGSLVCPVNALRVVGRSRSDAPHWSHVLRVAFSGI